MLDVDSTKVGCFGARRGCQNLRERRGRRVAARKDYSAAEDLQGRHIAARRNLAKPDIDRQGQAQSCPP